MRRTVGAIIVDDHGRVFVHRRGFDRELFPGCWDIPGGHVEPGEGTLDALSREIHEETGWRLERIVAELGEQVWTGDDGIERHERDYVVEVGGDLSAPRLEQPHHVDWAWVSLEELDELIDDRVPNQALVRELVARGVAAARRHRENLGSTSGQGRRT
jgi:8-oxo-dGTP diphosphatase